MSSTGDTDLLDLSVNILALVEQVEICLDRIDVAPEYVRGLWDEIQSLKNVVQCGTNLGLNFAILETPKTAEALEVIQGASNIVNDLRIVVKTINDADPAAATVRVSASDCRAYSESLVECREKLITSLNFLQMLVILPL